MWKKFIQCVSLDEKEKNVTVVAIQGKQAQGFFTSTKEFTQTVLTDEYLDFLEQEGFGPIVVKGEEEENILRGASGSSKRKFTVVFRPVIKPEDVKQLELASERILATGDNSASQAFTARCKMYMYELVGMHKTTYSQQQIQLGASVLPELGEFLTLASIEKEWTPEETARVCELIQHPALHRACFDFCQLISREYDFEPVLEASLKRALWMHVIPELMAEEASAMNPEFKEQLFRFFRGELSAGDVMQVVVTCLPQLEEKIHALIQHHIDFAHKEGEAPQILR
jgi:hypothetical protein